MADPLADRGHILSATEGCTCLACGGTDPVNPPDLPDPWK